MATRFYLPLSGAAPTSPTVSTMWDGNCSAFARYMAVTTKVNSALANVVALFGFTGTRQICWHQWVSDTLDVDQTISGTMSAVVRGLENATNADLHLAVSIRVLQGDTSTLRGVLRNQGATVTEYVTTAATRIHNALAVTSVNALAGDRIAIEVGFHGLTPAPGATGTLRFGDPTGTADFALTSGLTTDLCPWVQLSANITFGTPGGGATTKDSQVIFF